VLGLPRQTLTRRNEVSPSRHSNAEGKGGLPVADGLVAVVVVLVGGDAVSGLRRSKACSAYCSAWARLRDGVAQLAGQPGVVVAPCRPPEVRSAVVDVGAYTLTLKVEQED